MEEQESQYVKGIADHFKRALPGGTSIRSCSYSSFLAPVRCEMSGGGIEVITRQSMSYPAAEARIAMRLDGFDTYLKIWKNVPRSSARFQFSVCAQVAKLSQASGLGAQSIGGCSEFSLNEVIHGGAVVAFRDTTEAGYLSGQADWCVGTE